MIDRTNRYYLTTAEMLVMRVIWLSDHDLVLHEVVRECNNTYGKNWKPQTVSTYLSHLVQKEFLRMDRNGKIYSYHPVVTGAEFMNYDVENFAEYWSLSLTDMLKAYMKVREVSDEEKEALKEFVSTL